ncbi:MAG: hypothetical protein HRT69_10570 [Flavobacteriaceae bacterium]|nr:hypothetical protein [Flavobacteriaceae bacterium]
MMTQPQTTERNKYNIIYYILAMVCTVAFFMHEFVQDQSEEYRFSYNTHLQAKKQRTIKLNELKESAKNATEYAAYLVEKNKTSNAFSELKAVMKKESFLGFKNIQHFLGEFGWAFGLLIYSLFNLSLAFARKNKSLKGEIILHSSLIFIALYFINWDFQKANDYSKTTYVLYAIVIAIIIVYGTYLLVNHKNNYINTLKGSVRSLIDFISIKAKNKYVSEEDKLEYTKDYLAELKNTRKNG